MLQGGGFPPLATASEIVRLFAAFFRTPEDPDRLLDLVGLDAVRHGRYRTLSGGERQRLALAVALVGRPELLILDEPTAGMDPEAKERTRRLLADLRAAGRTILLTTHELTDVERLADRVLVIDRGRIVAEGPPAEVGLGIAPRLRFRLAAALATDDLGHLRQAVERAGRRVVELVDEGAGWYRVEGVAPDPRLVAAVATWCAERGALIVELRTAGGTLEERYLELVEGGRETADG
jgi:ABC-2 type transport system ATP-binding protein